VVGFSSTIFSIYDFWVLFFSSFSASFFFPGSIALSLKLIVQPSFLYCEDKIRPPVMTTHFSLFLSVIHVQPHVLLMCLPTKTCYVINFIFVFLPLISLLSFLSNKTYVLCNKIQKLELSRFFCWIVKCLAPVKFIQACY